MFELKYVLAIVYFVLFLVVYRYFTKITVKAVLVGVVTLLFLIVISVLNDQLNFIEEKVASFVAYEMYAYGRQGVTFFIQYLLVYLPFLLFDYPSSPHGLNMGLQAFCFVFILNTICKSKLDWKFYIILLFPAYYNFSIFGFRDPLINLCCIFIAFAAIKLNPKDFVVFCVIFSIVFIGLRPEVSLIVMGFAILNSFFGTRSQKKKIIIVLSSLIALYISLHFLPVVFGLSRGSSIADNINIVIEFNERRNSRRIGGAGSGSHILGGALYEYNILIRYPIQVVATFIAPLPFEIKNVAQLFAFIESLFFTAVCIIAFKLRKSTWQSYLLFYCGMAYMLLIAIFSINYGNIVRMRYPCFIFFAASIIADQRYMYLLNARDSLQARTHRKNRFSRG